jgi:4,5-DOPA dioxygenase extradiol
MTAASRMPVIFVAHGAPLVAIDDARAAPLVAWGRRLPRPTAVLVLSAHWEAPLSLGSTARHDALIYDFGRGLPPALFSVRWPAPGAPSLAARLLERIAHRQPRQTDRGLDHGAWTVLLRLFPEADVPTLQVSVPRDASEGDLVLLGRELAPLRDEGVLIVGSGNVVHNLSTLDVTESKPTPAWALAGDRF